MSETQRAGSAPPRAPRHPFRFGLLAARASGAAEWTALARRAEAAGYSTLLAPDTTGPTLAPLPALAVAAACTTTLHVGTWVLVADFRNPVLVAREAATLDLLSEGRFELGMGAGREDNDYAGLGITLESGGVRVRRLAEAVRIIDPLLRGERVTASGAHYSVRDAAVLPPPLRRPPILLAAGGRRALELAGAEADIVALGSMARQQLTDQLGWLSAAAGDRFAQIELALTFFVLPENDERARQVTTAILGAFGLDLEAMIAAGAPNLLRGSPAAMAEQLEAVRETFGISYVATGTHVTDAIAPVIAQLAGR
jgi:probable F420-dependent oxidoreductase